VCQHFRYLCVVMRLLVLLLLLLPPPKNPKTLTIVLKDRMRERDNQTFRKRALRHQAPILEAYNGRELKNRLDTLATRGYEKVMIYSHGDYNGLVSTHMEGVFLYVPHQRGETRYISVDELTQSLTQVADSGAKVVLVSCRMKGVAERIAKRSTFSVVYAADSCSPVNTTDPKTRLKIAETGEFFCNKGFFQVRKDEKNTLHTIPLGKFLRP